MSLHLTWICDTDGCEETAVTKGIEAVCPSNERGRPFFVLDSEWIDGPEGWSFYFDPEGLKNELTFCPAHNPEGVAGTVAEDTTELPSGSEGGPR